MDTIIVGLLGLCCLLAVLATAAAIRLRNTVDATLRGGTEQTGTLRGDLNETKKIILTLDAKIAQVNQKVIDHQKAVQDLRAVIDDLRILIKPESGQGKS
jgi:hypothetical protein